MTNNKYNSKQAGIAAITALILGAGIVSVAGEQSQASFFGPPSEQPVQVEKGIIDESDSVTQGENITVGYILRKQSFKPVTLQYKLQLDNTEIDSGTIEMGGKSQKLGEITTKIPATQEPGVQNISLKTTGNSPFSPVEVVQFENRESKTTVIPAQDSDNDGINNIVDECPQEFGSKENGCPTSFDSFLNLFNSFGFNFR